MKSRQKAYKENPKIAMMTDWLTSHEEQLQELFLMYKLDTGDREMEFIPFVVDIYENYPELVINQN